MAEIFLSYKATDRPRVAHLVAALRAGGLDVWWDQDIPVGGGWRETIAAELDAATLCVVAWSHASTGADGRFVREEAERAAARRAYLGVLIDPVLPPFGFAEWQSIDLSHWDGERSDPLLAQFVGQVRARLENRPAEPLSAPRPRRRRSLAWPIAAASAALIASAIAVAVWLLYPRGDAPPPPPPAMSPTAFVNARLDATGCSWLQIADVASAPGGERIALSGLALSPAAVQSAIMRDAIDASIPIAEIGVDDVAIGPNETCAELDLLRQYRSRGRPHLHVTQPRGAFRRTPDGWEIGLEYEIDYAGLPPDAALFGLDSIGGVSPMIEDLHAFRRETTPRRVNGSRATFYTIMTDDNQGARNVGLILMTASGRIDRGLVEDIGSHGDRGFLTRVSREARRRNWQFELQLVPCGFETNGTQRQC
jgi:hypothetical protein